MDEIKKEPINWGQEIWEFVKMLLISIVVVFLCTRFLIRPVRVDGDSMYPTLHNNAIGFSNILTYRMQGLKRFDVAIIYVPEKKEHLVKRVIGLPGETVQIKNGQIYIDDKPLEADKGLGQVSLAGLAENPVVLEEDEYFLLGDNRDSSEDSRFVKIGNVKRRQIRGKVWLRLIPFIDFKLVE